MKRKLALARAAARKKETVSLEDRVKNAMREKKISGSTLLKHLQELDKDHDNFLTHEEFGKVFKVLDIPLKISELDQLKSKMNIGKTDNIGITDLLSFFAPSLSEGRVKVLEECFKTICPSGTGVTTREHLRERFGKGEYTVIGGRRVKVDELIESLVQEFDQNNSGSLTKSDFMHYYKKFDEGMPDDEEFANLVKTSWEF